LGKFLVMSKLGIFTELKVLAMSRGVVAPLALATALRGISSTVLMTFLPVYAVLNGVELPEVGTISAIASGISVAVIPVAGAGADVLGRRVMLVISTVLLAVAAVVPLLLSGYLGVLVSYILFYASLNTWVPARAATVADQVGAETMGSSFALISMSFQASRIATPYVAGLLIKNFGYGLVFAISSAVALGAGAVVVALIEGGGGGGGMSLKEFLAGIKPRREELGFQVFLCVDRCGWRFWIPILNSYMKANLGFGEDVIGLVNTFRGVASLVGVLPAGKLVDRFGWVPALLASEVTGAAAALMGALATTPAGMAAALTFMGLSIALWVPGFNVAVPSIAPAKSELGRAYARSTFYRSLTSVPAPWVGGMLYSIAPVLPMLTGAFFLIADAAVLRVVAKAAPTSKRS